jgi:hypothetical protein
MIRKLKNMLGIEGVKINIEAPESIHLGMKMLSFKVHFFTKSDQHIESVSIRLIEKYRRGWGNSKLIDEYLLYDEKEDLDFELKSEEQFTIPLNIEFEFEKSPVEKMGEKFLLKPFSKLAMMTKRVKSTFRLEVSADVKGVKMNPLTVHHFEKSIN